MLGVGATNVRHSGRFDAGWHGHADSRRWACRNDGFDFFHQLLIREWWASSGSGRGPCGTRGDIRAGDTRSFADGLHSKIPLGRESERNIRFLGRRRFRGLPSEFRSPSSSCPTGAATPSLGPEAPGIRMPERPPLRRPWPSAPLGTLACARRTTGSAECHDDGHRRVRLIGLVNDRELLCPAPAPPTFRTGEDFHLKIATSHITNITSTHLAK